MRKIMLALLSFTFVVSLSSFVSAACTHSYKHDEYIKIDDTSHKHLSVCDSCKEVVKDYGVQTHSTYNGVQGYEKYDDTHHIVKYYCHLCDSYYGKKEKHGGNLQGWKDFNSTYHIASYHCYYCSTSYDEKEEHTFLDAYLDHNMYEARFIRVDGTYHANGLACWCGRTKAGEDKSLHDWYEDRCIKAATLNSKGTVQYRCADCNATKKVTSSWKLGDDNSVSYDPWNSNVYNNAKKIKIHINHPIKGSTLKVKIGKKTYKKKIKNGKKVFNLKIKKAKYGSKITMQIVYNGRVVGRSETDYVWYAKKLRKGMTKKQAKWTWGSPDDTSSSSGGWSYWDYEDGSYIGFKNGRIRYWYDAEG